jgi:hypothetical protein
MMEEKEKRDGKRLEFLRPIVYRCPDSDKFIQATMLNYSSGGICLQSAPPVTPGARIYIFTEEASFENPDSTENKTLFGKVKWCERKAGAHWVGVEFVNNSIVENSEMIFNHASMTKNGA